MNTEQKTRKSDVLSFRIGKENAAKVEACLAELNIDQSELIKEVFFEGWLPAIQKIHSRRQAEAKETLERAKGFEPSTFTLAKCMQLPVMDLAPAMLENSCNARNDGNGHIEQPGAGHFNEARPQIGQPVRKARSLRRDHIAMH